MPTYEFLCRNCEESFGVTLTITERASATIQCPNCQSEKGTPELTVFIVKSRPRGRAYRPRLEVGA